MTRPVGILGGMGPAAGADFVRLFVEACTEQMQRSGRPVNDQAFPEHWLAQVPVPDRSEALSHGGDEPLDAMAQAIERLRGCGAGAVAMACNTAHAWHARLQGRFPDTELLHVAGEVASSLRAAGVREVGLMATQGTYRTGLYDEALAAAGIACHLPLEQERATLMRGIYEGVKTGDLVLARRCFVEVAQALRARHGTTIALIMGCTEIPLALEDAPVAARWQLVNPARVLAQALASRAYG
jgi:aspartate racemase